MRSSPGYYITRSERRQNDRNQCYTRSTYRGAGRDKEHVMWTVRLYTALFRVTGKKTSLKRLKKKD